MVLPGQKTVATPRKLLPGVLPGLDQLREDFASGRLVPGGGLARNFAPLNYFETPRNVTKWYHKVNDNPNAIAPTWLDTKTLNLAYDFLKYKNKDLPEDEWLPVTPNDPVAAMYGAMAAPPVDQMSDYEKQYWSSRQSIMTGKSGKEVQAEWMNGTFWQDPKRVTRYYNTIKNMPPDWQGPNWISPTFLQQAYDIYKVYNAGKTPDHWEPLPANHPALSFLKDGPVPPQETWASWDQPQNINMKVPPVVSDLSQGDVQLAYSMINIYENERLQRLYKHQGLSQEEIDKRLKDVRAAGAEGMKYYESNVGRMPTNESYDAEGNAILLPKVAYDQAGEVIPQEEVPSFTDLDLWKQGIYSLIVPASPGGGDVKDRSMLSQAAAGFTAAALPAVGIAVNIGKFAPVTGGWAAVAGVAAGLTVFASGIDMQFATEEDYKNPWRVDLKVIPALFKAIQLGAQIPEATLGAFAMGHEEAKQNEKKGWKYYDQIGWVDEKGKLVGFDYENGKPTKLKAPGWWTPEGAKQVAATFQAASLFYETYPFQSIDILYAPAAIEGFLKSPQGVKAGQVLQNNPYNLQANKEAYSQLYIYLKSYPWRKSGQVYKMYANLPSDLEKNPVTGRAEMGAKALLEYRQMLLNGYSVDEVYADATRRYGMGGFFNDFGGQMMIDLLNVAPRMSLEIGAEAAKANNSVYLESFIRSKISNDPLVDFLPPVVDDLYAKSKSIITGKRVERSPGAITAAMEWKSVGRTGKFVWNYKNMPPDMMEAYTGAVKNGADPQTFKFNGSEMTWKDMEGAEQKFTSTRGVLVTDLTPLERRLMGVNEQGVISELTPYPENMSKAQKLFRLTPESQAMEYFTVYQDAVKAIVSESNDIESLINIVDAASKADPRAAQRADRAFMDTPVIYTVVDALKVASADPRVPEILAQWTSVKPWIATLNELGAATGLNPGKIVEMLATDAGIKELSLKVAGLENPPDTVRIYADPANIKKTIGKVFGEGKQDWHPAQFIARVIGAMSESVDKYLVDRYHISPDALGIRVSHFLKSVMSLMLLSNSVSYAINNEINNFVTRAAAGVSGYILPSQMEATFAEIGFTPTRFRVGIGLGGERNIDVITGKEGKPIVSAVAKAKQGGIDTNLDNLAKAQQTVRMLSNKFGFMTKLSNWLEKQESEQALFIGFMRFWDRDRVYGVGISPFPKTLDTYLNQYPITKALIIDALQTGKNMDQVIAKMYSNPDEIAINVTNLVNDVVNKRLPEAPQVLKDTINETIGPKLQELLPKAKSVQDINRIFDLVDSQIDNLVEKMHGESLRKKAEQASVLADAEQFPFILSAHDEFSRYIQNEWAVEHFNEVKAVFDASKDLDASETSRLWREQNAKDALRFAQAKDRHLGMLDGIFKILHVDNAEESLILTSTRAIYDAWNGFYDRTQEARTRFFKTTYSTKEARNTAYYTMELAIQEDYNRTYFGEGDNLGEQGLTRQIDESMARLYEQRTGRPQAEFLKWRQEVMDIRDKMVAAQLAMRDKAGKELLPAAKYDLLDQFFNKEYRALIDELETKKRDGAKVLFEKSKTAVPEPEKIVPGDVEPAKQVEADIVKKTTQTESNAAIDKAEIRSKAIQNRKMFQEAVLQTSPNILPAEMTAAMIVFDEWIERNWISKNPGKTIDDFYATVFDKVVSGVEKAPDHFQLEKYQDLLTENAFGGAVGRFDRVRMEVDALLRVRKYDEEIIQTILTQKLELHQDKVGPGEPFNLIETHENGSTFTLPLTYEEGMLFKDFIEAKMDIPLSEKSMTTYRKFLETEHPDHFNAENIGNNIFKQIAEEVGVKQEFRQPSMPVRQTDRVTMAKLNSMPETNNIRRTGFVTHEGKLVDIGQDTLPNGTVARGEHGDFVRKNFPQYEIKGDNDGTIKNFMQGTGAVRLSSAPTPDSTQFIIQSTGPLSQHQIMAIADGIMTTNYPDLIHVTAQIGDELKNISVYKATALEDLQEGLFRKTSYGDGIRYQQIKQNPMRIAKEYGFETAKETGAPNIPEEMHLLRAIKKYYPEKYGNMDVKAAMKDSLLFKMPAEDMLWALEERRIQKGLQPVFPEFRDDTKGLVSMGADGKWTLKLWESSDISTVIHEFGHVIRDMMSDQHRNDSESWIAGEITRLNQMKKDGKLTQEQLDSFFVDRRGNKLDQIELLDNGDWSYSSNEIFARAFERHLANDLTIPISKKMQRVFETLSQALRRIYDKVTGTNPDYTGTPLDLNINLKVKTADGRMVSIKDVFDQQFHGESLAKNLDESRVTLQGRPTGKTTFAFDPTDPNIKYNFQYKVVDLDELIPSNTDSFQPNENYPAVLQPPERGTKTSQKQVIDIAAGLVPEKVLIDVSDLSNGSPIIGDDMAVEGGNGRVLGFRLARESYPENWAKYRQYLVAHAAEFGLKPEDVEAIANPVLVRERIGLPDGVDRGEFAFRTSKDSAAGFTPEEIAMQDATKWKPALIAAIKISEDDSIDGALRLTANKEIINKFVSSLTDTTNMFTANGELSATGLQRIKASLFAAVFDSDAGRKLLRLFTENTDNNIKTLENTIYANLPALAKMEGKIKAGMINAEYSIADDLSRLIEEYGRRKREKIPMGQEDLFAAGSTADKKLIEFFYNNARSRKNMDSFLQEYIDLVNKQPAPDQQSLIPMEVVPKDTLLSIAVDHADLNTDTYFPTDYDGVIDKLPKPYKNTSLNKMIDRVVKDADGNVVAEMPVKFKLQRIKTTSGETATVLGYDPADANRLVYLVNGELRKTDPVTQEFRQSGQPIPPSNSDEFRKRFGYTVSTKSGEPIDIEASGRRLDLWEAQNVHDVEWSPKEIQKNWSAPDNSMDYGIAVENAGDIARELWLNGNFPDWGYIDEKVRKLAYRRFNVRKYLPLKADLPYLEKINNFWKKVKVTDPTQQHAVDLVNAILDRNIETLDREYNWFQEKVNQEYKPQTYRQPANPTGKVPPGSAPVTLDNAELNSEVNATILRPLISDLRKKSIEQFNNRPLKGMPVDSMPEPVKAELDNYLNIARSDMIKSKTAASAIGTAYRDNALLNYSRRFGFDDYFEMGIPYQFWFTRTMANWMGRMMERPALWAMWTKYQEMQKKFEDDLPSRFQGRTRMPAPFLPQGFGATIFSNPMAQLFPLSQITELPDNIQRNFDKQETTTKNIINEQVKSGEITQEEADAAVVEMNGNKVWDSAYAKGKEEQSYTDPYSLISLGMSPAMWIDIPYKLATGDKEGISNLPMTRQGRALGAALQDTPLQGVGNFAEKVMAGPENVVRKWLDLPEYSGWYDYYVNRSISNMAAEGVVTTDQAKYAIAYKQGPAYEMGVKRANQELSLRVPGTALIYALKSGMTLNEMPVVLIESLFPGGIMQDGEMRYRGLYKEYSSAWNDLEQGDLSAIKDFFKKHPEYSTRLAIFQDPETQMRNFITDKVWAGYMGLSAADRKNVAQQLGPQFQEEFLGGGAPYDNIPTDRLTYWAQFLGASLPQKAAPTKGQIPSQQTAQQPVQPAAPVQQYQPLAENVQITQPDLWDPATNAAITEYERIKDQDYPNIDAIQKGYYAYPDGSPEQDKYLARFKQLKQYWGWKKDYQAKHPELEPYFAKKTMDFTATGQKPDYTNEVVKQMTPELVNQLSAYYYRNIPLAPGAYAELRYLWESAGKPGGTLLKFIDNYVKPGFVQ